MISLSPSFVAAFLSPKVGSLSPLSRLRSSLHLLGIGPVLDRVWLMAIHSMIYNTPPWMS